MISTQTHALQISHNVPCNVPMHANLLRFAKHTDVTTQGSFSELVEFFFFSFMIHNATDVKAINEMFQLTKRTFYYIIL